MPKKNSTSLHVSILLVLILVIIIPLVNSEEWQQEKRLTSDPHGDWSPCIALTNDGKLWVFWHSYKTGDAELFYTNFDGVTWSLETRLTTDPSQDVLPNVMQTKDGTIWVVWTSNRTGNFDIFCKKSANNGASWSGETRLTANPSDDMAPSITQTKNGKIWVVWNTQKNGNDDLFYKVSSDNGVTWTNDIQLTNDVSNDRLPSIIQAKNGTIWVAWDSWRTGGSEIYYKTSSDDGLTWSPDTRLTKDPNFDLSPTIMQAKDGNMWVVWQSDRISVNGVPQDDVYYKIFDGSSWTDDTQLTSDPSDDVMPSIVQAANLTIWIVWSSDRNDDFDIYYRICNDFVIIHDVAVTEVTPLMTEVYRGIPIGVNVTVQNRGTVGETFDVAVYAKDFKIGNQTATILLPNNTATLTFTWDTSHFSPSLYTISAQVAPVPSERFTEDNQLIDGAVHVKIPGDINGDDAVSIGDATLFSVNYGRSAQEFPQGDFNGDYAINVFDVALFSWHYGDTA